MRLFIIFCCLLFIPFVSGWNWDTHQAFVDSMYYRLDDSLKHNLSLAQMEEGAIIPDRDFKDFRRHSFPAGIQEAEKWLEKTHAFLDMGSYKNASLTFGIASHYVTDSFAAPHSVSGEPYSLHRAYEDQASQSYLYAPCVTEHFRLGDILYTGSQQGATWKEWVETYNHEIPQRAVHEAAFYLTTVALDAFNSSCVSWTTSFEEEQWPLQWKDMAGIGIIILAMIIAAFSLYRDLKYH